MATKTLTHWELPHSAATYFPKSEEDRLENENNYYVWSIRMKSAYEVCDLWEVVKGIEKAPSPGSSVELEKEWKKKNKAATALMLQCIKQELVVKVAMKESANAIWEVFSSEYGQTGIGSLMLWFRRLASPLVPGGSHSPSR
ncbi:hypothetical protein GALMADRAFT_132711 [Galerina marginata CBS 339.88]|uniref:DUF4219 domain-containing protein n=1 Tax=Galerina marginata (strain CBS 339.88) TaxID=685588 RepID=A0A067U3T9_GALM3|nr:hypothetical protein GALMADRAFT_132711 [Galerina marginata CBS 339.88]